ncbi:MAG: translocation/assembly module TamB [Bacteroidales bacterium]|nr:translocation/assembly module TamB [Bacteroidales bacterium]
MLILSVVLFLETPQGLTWVGQRVMDRLKDVLPGKLHFTTAQVSFNSIHIKDVYFLDEHPYTEDRYGRGWAPVDTLFHAGDIYATFTLRGLLSRSGLEVSRVKLLDGAFNFVTEPGERWKSNIERILQVEPQEEQAGLPELLVHKVEIGNFHFTMRSFDTLRAPHHGIGINWEDLDIVANIQANSLRINEGIITGNVPHIDLREKSGCEIENIEGVVRVGGGLVRITDFILQDAFTDLRLPIAALSFRNSDDFADFINKVNLDISFAPSRVGWQTVKYFADALPQNQLLADIRSGSVQGPVSALEIHGFDFHDRNSDVSARASVDITGLPDLPSTLFDIQLDNASMTSRGLSTLLSGFSEGKPVDLSNIAPRMQLVASGSAYGTLNALQAHGTIDAGGGTALADLLLTNLITPRPIGLSGSLAVNELNLARVLGIEALGPCSARASLSATLQDKGLPTFTLDSLCVDHITALGYDYHGIDLAGAYDGTVFDARALANDPALGLLFEAYSEQTPDGTLYHLDATLDRADLQALQLDKRGTSRASIQAVASLLQTGDGAMNGEATISGLVLENDSGAHDIGEIHVGLQRDSTTEQIQLQSGFLDALFSGSRSITDLAAQIQNLSVRKELPALFPSDNTLPECPGDYNLDLSFKDSRELLAFILPGLYIADGSDAAIRIGGQGSLTGWINSPRLAFGSNYLRNARVDLDNGGNAFNLALGGNELNVGGLRIRDSRLDARLKDNGFGASFGYDSIDGLSEFGSIRLEGEMMRDEQDSLLVTVRPRHSELDLKQSTWTIEDSEIQLASAHTQFNNFRISSGTQFLSVKGGMGPACTDTLSVGLYNLDVSLANYFLAQDYGIQGILNGQGYLFSPVGEQLQLQGTVLCDSLQVGNRRIGSLRLGTHWDDEQKQLVSYLRNTLDDRESIDMDAIYKPRTRELDLKAIFDQLELGAAAPFLASTLSELDGHLSGDVHVTGPMDALRIESDNAQLEDVLVRVAFTNVPYTINGPLRLDDNGIHLRDLRISDHRDGYGTLSGSIRHKSFRDIRLDARLYMSEMAVLDKPDTGDGLSGTLFASGSAGLRGPLDALVIDADISTARNGDVRLPLSSAANATNSDILTFVQEAEEKDPYEQMIATTQQQQKSPGNTTIKARVNITPEVQAHLDIDKAAGSTLSAYGNGMVDLDMQTSLKQIQLNGGYTLSGGNFNFAVPGVTAKNFDIKEGSTIGFGGDVMDTHLDIDAVYTVRASLAPLISDSTSVSTRRNVLCGIHIQDRVANPEVSFSIDIPDLDPSAQSNVDSALDSEDKVQKQFVSLLLLGTFLPTESSGVINSNSILYSNVSEMMASQLNNILQRLDVPLDLGFNYQHNEGGTDIFDVAVSTQLFNDRVLVSGSVGNRKYSNAGGANGNMVGDLDIQIKLDKPGQLRLDLFSHSADELTNYLDYSQRNGVGLSYQREFNNYREFFRSLFSSKEKREEMKANEAEQEAEKVVIQITE